ncbi:Maf family protein [Lichenicola sp.]|uniref:Maf family protein n=1 Tax=Lichenicola sp. TaxID=2804529 RepID=UPI003B001272
MTPPVTPTRLALSIPAAAGLQASSPALVLASSSQTRLRLLRDAGLRVTARSPTVDEAALKTQALAACLLPSDAALMLAEHKAASIHDPDAIVIGADQLLVCEGRWFDKPSDQAAAKRQLQALSGHRHVLHTAVVCQQYGRTLWQHVAAPALDVRPLTEAFLAAYLALEGDTVLQSVGSYRLEGPGVQLFEAVDGEYAAILGLPMLALLGFLRRQNLLLS